MVNSLKDSGSERTVQVKHVWRLRGTLLNVRITLARSVSFFFFCVRIDVAGEAKVLFYKHRTNLNLTSKDSVH